MSDHGLIPRSFIDDLISRVDIVAVINEHVPLKKRGANFLACCPFHNEKTPSFSVNQTNQFYYCFGCGASGNAVSFLMEYTRQSFVESIETLANLVGMSIPSDKQGNYKDTYKNLYKILDTAAQYYAQQLREHPDAKKAIEYLKQRGLTGQIAKKYAIGYASDDWDNLLKYLAKDTDETQLIKAGLIIKNDKQRCYDRFRNRIIFPIRDQRGRVIAFGGRVLDNNDQPKYLNSPETPVFHKSHEIYGLYEILGQHRHPNFIIVVEGYMDVIALAQHGIQQCVATLGTSISQEHIRRLFRHTNKLIFCFDGDKAGRQAAWRSVESSLGLLEDNKEITFMFLPENQDPDNIVRKEGKECFIARTKKATSLSAFLFHYLQSDIDLSTTDGRAHFVKNIGPYIKKINAPILQQMLIQELANLIHMDPLSLAKFIGTDMNNDNSWSLTKQKKSSPTNTPPSLMRRALSLLLQYPSLANEVKNIEAIKQWNIPGIHLLTKLTEELQQHPHLSVGAILERWRDERESKQLAKLAATPHFSPSEGAAKEFVDALKRLQLQASHLELEKLLSIAQQTPLSDEQKKRMQALLHACNH